MWGGLKLLPGRGSRGNNIRGKLEIIAPQAFSAPGKGKRGAVLAVQTNDRILFEMRSGGGS